VQYWHVLDSFVVKWCPIETYRRASMGFLKDLVEERMNWKVEEKGTKPDDLVQWLVDAAPPIERTIPQLVERIMAMNVASIHTTTMVGDFPIRYEWLTDPVTLQTFSGALYCLAAEPEKYLPALRAEVKQHCIEGQITKETLTKLTKMDSFLREAGRFMNAGLRKFLWPLLASCPCGSWMTVVAMNRNAKKEFRFSDNTVIPAGARVGTPSLFVHRDPTIYENPEEFDGFRFSRLREKNPGAEGVKNSMVSTDPAYHVFGHGKHAWWVPRASKPWCRLVLCVLTIVCRSPGRFFAVNEMKLILSTLIMRYDIKLVPGTKPESIFIGTLCLPDTKLKVLLKRI
jgi:cytochrome P450